MSLQPDRKNIEQFERKTEEIKIKPKKKVTQLTAEQIKEKGILESWGDEVHIQDNWPSENELERLRIVSININGISTQANYFVNNFMPFHCPTFKFTCDDS